MPACKLKAKCFGESDPLINPYIIIILLIIIIKKSGDFDSMNSIRDHEVAC